MRDLTPDVHKSFCVVHSVFGWMGDSAGAIYQSRVLTMASTSTRKAPTCFNHLHQLRKLTILGCSPEADASDWNRKQGVMKPAPSV